MSVEQMLTRERSRESLEVKEGAEAYLSPEQKEKVTDEKNKQKLDETKITLESFSTRIDNAKKEKDNIKKGNDLVMLYIVLERHQKEIQEITGNSNPRTMDIIKLGEGLDQKCDTLKGEIMSDGSVDKEKLNSMLSESFGNMDNKEFLKQFAKDQRLEKITKPPKEAKDVKSGDDIRFTFTFNANGKPNDNLLLKTTAGQVLPSEVKEVECEGEKYFRDGIEGEFFTLNNQRLIILEGTLIKIGNTRNSEEITKLTKENELKVAEYMKLNPNVDQRIVSEAINRGIDPKIAIVTFGELAKNTPKDDFGAILEDAFTEYDRIRDYNNVSSKEQTGKNFFTLILELLMKFNPSNWKELAKNDLNIDDNHLKEHESNLTSINERSSKIKSFDNLDENKSFKENAIAISKEIEKVYGIPWKITVSQAALESKWGKSKLSTKGNNYFGIKSFGKGPSINFNTKEVVNGKTVTVNAGFKAFGNMKDSFIGYANFLTKNQRYRNAFNFGADLNPKPEYYSNNYQGYDPEKFASEIAKAGYATDPNYYQKIVSISRELDDNIA
ncbi:hypothetical protein EOM39_05445 [Candidatus Gracilibacteria bacterium]|nr:hypothetical protein [Candidatus Gracilibacteria bacterium]